MTSLPKKTAQADRQPRSTLRTIAQLLSLTPATVSAALNNSAAAKSISDRTKKRILAAARELNYCPNYFARTLRLKRTYTVGVIAEEIGHAYGAMVLSGIEEYLRKNDFFFLTVIHRHDQQLVQTYAQMLLTRGVEGFITIDASIMEQLPLPTVAVAGHDHVEGVTNITLDHNLGARLALTHLLGLGHREIAFLEDHPASPDSAARWAAICAAATELGIRIREELTVHINSTVSTPHLGYSFAKELLSRRQPFTALVACNDLSAIGAIRAFREARVHVPEDVSVIGFDDIPAAAFADPGLTAVRQPLQRMGQIAAKSVIDQIEGLAEWAPEITIEPEFVVRGSTGPAHSLS